MLARRRQACMRLKAEIESGTSLNESIDKPRHVSHMVKLADD